MVGSLSCNSSGILYVLALALLFNGINICLYFAIFYYKGKTTRSSTSEVRVETTYICNKELEKDIEQAFALPTLSSYATNTYRGGFSMLAMTLSTAFTLMMINIYNATVNNLGIVEQWIVLVSYSCLILVGLFASNEVLVDDRRVPIRDHNVFFCCWCPLPVSAFFHAFGATVYLFIPTILNIQANWFKTPDGKQSYYSGIAYLSLVISIMYVGQQFTILYLGDNLQLIKPLEGIELQGVDQKTQAIISNNVMALNKIRKFLFFLSYTIELLAIPVATAEYLYIELTLVSATCGGW